MNLNYRLTMPFLGSKDKRDEQGCPDSLGEFAIVKVIRSSPPIGQA
jgi:hypothetical protein